MALKSVTLRLDEEEYEKLKEYLSEFGDPDINVAYVLRSYIRDLNRALPFVKSGWDLKNYFGMLGSWLKQFSSMQDQEMFAKMMVNPWAFWNTPSARGHGEEGKDTVESKKKGPEEKHNKGKGDKA
jgi:hypothetical protein